MFYKSNNNTRLTQSARGLVIDTLGDDLPRGPQLPVNTLVDRSGSMQGSPIVAVNQGIRNFVHDCLNDVITRTMLDPILENQRLATFRHLVGKYC